MKVTIKIEKEVEVTTLSVNAAVRYWEDSVIDGKEDTENGDLVPCKHGSQWQPQIDVNTGIIMNWRQGTTAAIHYKVCDAGVYILRDEAGNQISEVEGYVPHCLCPKEEGFGDYIIMDVDENGKIEGWEFCESDIDWLMDHE